MEMEVRTDVTCRAFYDMVFEELPEELRPKGCRRCQMALFMETDERMILPLSQTLSPTEGEVFLLFLTHREYMCSLSMVDEVFNEEPFRYAHYDEFIVNIVQLADEENKEIDYEGVFYSEVERRGTGRCLRDGQDVPTEIIFSRRGSSERVVAIPESYPYLTVDEIIELVLRRAEEVMELPLSVKECLRQTLLGKYEGLLYDQEQDQEQEQEQDHEQEEEQEQEQEQDQEEEQDQEQEHEQE